MMIEQKYLDLISAAEAARKLLFRLRERGTIGDAPEIRLLAMALNKIDRTA